MFVRGQTRLLPLASREPTCNSNHGMSVVHKRLSPKYLGLPASAATARAGTLDRKIFQILLCRKASPGRPLRHPTNPLLRVRNESIYYKIFIDRTKPDNSVRINPAARYSEPIYGFVVLTGNMIFEDFFVGMKLLLRHKRLSYAAANSHQNQLTCSASKTKPRGG